MRHSPFIWRWEPFPVTHLKTTHGKGGSSFDGLSCPSWPFFLYKIHTVYLCSSILTHVSSLCPSTRSSFKNVALVPPHLCYPEPTLPMSWPQPTHTNPSPPLCYTAYTHSPEPQMSAMFNPHLSFPILLAGPFLCVPLSSQTIPNLFLLRLSWQFKIHTDCFLLWVHMEYKLPLWFC